MSLIRRGRALAVAIIAAAALISFVGLTMRRSHAATVPARQALPSLSFRSADGTRRLTTTAQPSLVVLFQSTCGHCHVELQALDAAVDRLGAVRLVFLTPEATLPTEHIRASWPRLAAAPNVVWGSLGAAEMQRTFGTLDTPTIFVYRANGELADVVRGEAKVEFLLRHIAG